MDSEVPRHRRSDGQLVGPPARPDERHAAIAGAVARGADVDKAEEDGWTPLFMASQDGHAAIAALLLDRGADVDKATKAA
ncbi:hypothetical protein JL720_16541 [Aureococcus anophagefferens]|nr:hypothetical protein JL720_16541 [Aureococcus anophagefferens]